VNGTLTWVIGAGGLLGSNVLKAFPEQALGAEIWNPGESQVSWQEPGRAFLEISTLAESFAAEVSSRASSWALLWCAGSGVVGTTAETLALETSYLGHLLKILGERLPDIQGKVLLASSAGGVYGNNTEQPLTETSVCMPISAYGQNKLAQERVLLNWAECHSNVSTLIARISNLYGPGQNLQKSQGLIAHISRSLIHHAPVYLYVPLDTIRDYVFASDCAAQLVCGLKRLRGSPTEHVVRIFSAGETVTIARIIAIFARIAKGHPRIIYSANPMRALQPGRLQFKASVWTDLHAPAKTDLAIGIQRVHQHQLALYQQGRLPPSPAID
jgi:UDP-glucose 4-epimerase